MSSSGARGWRVLRAHHLSQENAALGWSSHSPGAEMPMFLLSRKGQRGLREVKKLQRGPRADGAGRQDSNPSL